MKRYLGKVGDRTFAVTTREPFLSEFLKYGEITGDAPEEYEKDHLPPVYCIPESKEEKPKKPRKKVSE